MECQPTFEFVIQGPKSNGFSKETRTRIRRQAMKAVGAARRQSGRYGKHNQRQSPPELRQKTIDIALRLAPQACVVEEGKTGRKDTADASWPSDRTCSLTVPSPMPLSGIDAMVRDHGICPTDLSALTSAHIGRVASKILSSHSRMLVSLLSYPSWSYFSMIPGRFGYSSCLDDAVLCLMGKARILLAPSSKTSETLILSNYGKALQSLQSAVNNPALCTSADVLCATEVLALFELLHAPTFDAWRQHIAGASRLVQLRGPDRFKTDFEKALLIALAGPIMCEGFLNNEECFLDQPQWRKVLLSARAAEEDLSDRSPLAVDLSLIMASMLGVAKRVTHTICHTEEHEISPLSSSPAFSSSSASSFSSSSASSLSSSPRSPTSHLDELVEEARRLRKRVQEWRTRFQLALIARAGGGQGDAEKTARIRDKRFDMLGTALVLTVISARLIGALSPGSQRGLLEDEAQAAAHEIKELEGQVAPLNPRAGFYLAQKARVAESALGTAKLWTDSLASGGRVIDRWRFQRWCEAVPRCYSTEGCCE